MQMCEICGNGTGETDRPPVQQSDGMPRYGAEALPGSRVKVLLVADNILISMRQSAGVARKYGIKRAYYACFPEDRQRTPLRSVKMGSPYTGFS